MSSRILFISKSIVASSTRYRALQFYPLLKEQNIVPCHVEASGGLLPLLNTFWKANQADTVIVLRKTFPFIFTKILRFVSKTLIFDLDDAIFCRSDGNPSKTRMKRFGDIARMSDHIFAGNNFLAQTAKTYNANVTIIPTCLDIEKYNVDPEKPVSTIDIVWIGSKSTSKYLKDILPILEKTVEKVPQIRLKIIADFELTSNKIDILCIPWSEKTETKEIASSHIGIAPMIENDWTRGKCALKVLQYMAAKLPVISSNVGVNSQVIKPNKTGYLTSIPEQWIDAILQLSENPSLRENMGISGYNRVKKTYNLHVVFKKINHLINKP